MMINTIIIIITIIIMIIIIELHGTPLDDCNSDGFAEPTNQSTNKLTPIKVN